MKYLGLSGGFLNPRARDPNWERLVDVFQCSAYLVSLSLEDFSDDTRGGDMLTIP